MNKIKFIPALALVALLSACGSKASGIKAPKFEKEGSAVEKEVCAQKSEAKLSALEIFGDKKIGSTTSSFDAKMERKASLKRGGKMFNERGMMIDYHMAVEADAKSLVFHSKGEETYTSSGKDLHGKYSNVESMNFDYYAQQIFYGETEFFGNVDVSLRTYTPYTEVTENRSLADLFDEFAKEVIIQEGGLYYFIQELSSAFNVTDEAADNFKFYQNGDIFTVTYEYAPEAQEVKNDNDEVIYTAEQKSSAKFQMIFNGKDFRGISYTESTTTTKYLLDYQNSGEEYFAGDIYEEKAAEVMDCVLKSADLNLKPADYSTYQFIDSMI